MPRRVLPPPCVLTIAGSDSGGGAGVQADARTIHALGGFACMAITAITAQNTRGVQRWEPVSPALLGAQIGAVLGPVGSKAAATDARAGSSRVGARVGGDGSGARAGAGGSGALPVRAVKTGLIPSAAAVRVIARGLSGCGAIPLVVDPVIGSTTGTLFLDRAGVRALTRELLPRATLVTPNWPEAEVLSGRPLQSFADAERAGRAIADAWGCAVLVKGGHGPGGVCRDCLVLRDGRVCWFESERLATPNIHGTGCVLAAAIATELAKGRSLVSAVKSGRAFLHTSLRRHRNVEWGGAGPAFPGGPFAVRRA